MPTCELTSTPASSPTEIIEFIKFHEPSENRDMWCVRRGSMYLTRVESSFRTPVTWRELDSPLPYITGDKSLNTHSLEVKRETQNQINNFLDFCAFDTFYDAAIASVARITLDTAS